MTSHPERGPGNFDDVIERFGDALSRMAWGYTDNAADHADLLQEILVALWQSLPRFRGDASLWTFVFRVAHNRALSFVGRQRRQRWLPLTETVLDPKPGPDATVERVTERERLLSAVRQLPPPLRQAIMLSLEGASPGDIAAVQGISEGNASVRLTRARKALQELLNPGGAAHE